MKKTLIILGFVFQVGYAQDNYVEKALEFLSEHYISSVQYESNDGLNGELLIDDVENRLIKTLDNPIKINACSYESLCDFPLFNEKQIFHILTYKRRYRDFRSLDEFKLLPQFSDELIAILLPFIDFSIQKVNYRRKRKVRLVGTNKFYFTNDSSLTNYLGSAAYQALKLEVKDLLPKYSFAVNIEKDNGELWYNAGSGFEHANFYINYADDASLVKQIIVGTYKASFGQGLVVHTGYNNYRSRFVQNGTSFSKQKLKPQSSNNESSSFKGAAADFQFLNIECSAFASVNKFDATIHTDTVGSFFSSIGNSGMHRTELELSKKDKVGAKDVGLVLSYLEEQFNVSWNHVYSKLSLPFSRDNNYYNKEYFTGSQFYTQSLDFNFLWNSVLFFGELAMDKEFDVAFLSGVSGSIEEVINYRALYRNYGRKFQSFRGKSYQQSGQLRNEKGLVIQVDGRFGAGFSYHAWYDIYKFPEMSYRKRFSSLGSEKTIKVLYSGVGGFRAHIQLKSKAGQKNVTEGMLYEIHNENRRSLQLNYSLQVNDALRCRGQFQFMLYSVDTNQDSGVLFFQEFKQTINKITFGPRLTVFSIDSYGARIYVYEPSLRYSSPFLFFKDTGFSLSGLFKWQVDEYFTMSAKLYAVFTRDNSLSDVSLRSKSGVNVQCSVKF